MKETGREAGQILLNSLLSHSSTCSGSHFKPFSCCSPVCGSTQWLNKSLESNVTSLSDSCLDRAKNSGHIVTLKNTTSSDNQLLIVWRTDQGVFSLELVRCQKEDEVLLCKIPLKKSHHRTVSEKFSSECYD